MAMFVSYYRLYGSVANVYESVLTKGFLHGRTGACRSASREAVHFARTFCSAKASSAEKLGALRAAAKAHGAQVEAL